MKPPVDSSVKSVKRALDLIELLANEHEPPSFLELMRRLQIPRSSLFHLMGELMTRGYVEQTPGGSRYRPGPMLAIVAARAARRSWLVDIVRPVLRELSDRTNEFSAFYVVEGDLVRGLVVEDGTHGLSYRIEPNHLAPMHAFAAGKVALADRMPEALEAYLENVERQRYTANTITDANALRAAVNAIRRDGYGRSCSEYVVGVIGFAMPVRAGGELVGIVNVSIPEPRASTRHQEEVVGHLGEAITRLVDRLDGDGNRPVQAVGRGRTANH